MSCPSESPHALRSPFRVPAVISYIVLLAAMGPSLAAAVIPTYHLPDYWPVLDNVHLSYLRDTGEGLTTTIAHSISGPMAIYSHYAYRLSYRDTSTGDWVRDYMNWSNGALEYVLYKDSLASRRTYTNPLEIMPFDLSANASHLLVGDGGEYYTDSDIPGSDTVRVTCDGFEDITVPAGSYRTLHVETVRDWKNNDGFHGNDVTHYWLAQKLGPVRRYVTFSRYNPNRKKWIISTQDDQLATAPTLVDLSASMPPVASQADASAGVGYYNSGDYTAGYDAGVCWAMGYYYKSFQETMQAQAAATARAAAALASPPPVMVSPYFLWSNGGGHHFHFAGALMTAWGVPPLETFDSYATVTSDTHLAAAANYKALGCYSFFAHIPTVSDTGRFTSVWANDLTPLKERLSPPVAEGRKKPGDCLVLGIPVFQSFLNYTGGVYDVDDATQELFLGYQAVCVVGCSDITHSFQIVNSWGTGWGENGYGSLSYTFVRKYAIEAWWMADSTGFALDPYSQPIKNGATYIYKTKDYRISYTPFLNGKIGVTESGIRINGGDKRDTLAIKRRTGALAGETVPSVVTDGGFATIYTDAPIALLQASGQIKTLTAKANVETVVGQDFRAISITAAPNSTWQSLFWWTAPELHPNGYHEVTGYWLNNYAWTEIIDTLTTTPIGLDSEPRQTTAAAIPRAAISLTGTILYNLASNKGVTLTVATKKREPAGAPAFYSYGGVDGGATINVVGDLYATVAGGAFAADTTHCYGVRNVSATGLRLSTGLRTRRTGYQWRYVDYYNGDVDLGSLFSEAAIANISATGGDVLFHSIASRMNIANLSAKLAQVRLRGGQSVLCGGHLGDLTSPTANVITAGYGEALNEAWATIDTVSAGLLVAGKFVAGSDAGGAPNYVGLVNAIKVGPAPLPLAGQITGEAYVKPGSLIDFVGDHSGFAVHYGP